MFGKDFLHTYCKVKIENHLLKDFGENIKELSIKTGKSIAKIKNNIYRDIVGGEWWNIKQYFEQFHQMMEGNDTYMEKSISQGKCTSM